MENLSFDAAKNEALEIFNFYHDTLTNFSQQALVVFAQLHGSASLEDVAKVIKIPETLKARVFAAVPGPLIQLGVIRLIKPEKVGLSSSPALHELRYEIADNRAARNWHLQAPTDLRGMPEAVRKIKVSMS
ncbi:MAG TPA: hypothetical protein VHR66_26475 [Gemmataceae bacterium]|jgi:hypothetical protein|nr:hypothetical protein [Gemmataceae bacterium]